MSPDDSVSPDETVNSQAADDAGETGAAKDTAPQSTGASKNAKIGAGAAVAIVAAVATGAAVGGDDDAPEPEATTQASEAATASTSPTFTPTEAPATAIAADLLASATCVNRSSGGGVAEQVVRLSVQPADGVPVVDPGALVTAGWSIDGAPEGTPTVRIVSGLVADNGLVELAVPIYASGEQATLTGIELDGQPVNLGQNNPAFTTDLDAEVAEVCVGGGPGIDDAATDEQGAQ